MHEFGLLGEKLAHSYSPLIHSMLGDYRYDLLPCTQQELDALLRERPFRGMNVTIPYKKDAYARCDDLSPEARLLGNVNTVLTGSDGRLYGHNTDLHGFLSMVQASGIQIEGRKVAVLGTGGSGSTARVALESLGAREVLSVSRSGSLTYDVFCQNHHDTEVIVNATPVGMFPDNGASPVDLGAFPDVEGVLDLIYNPYRTALILDALERGIPCRSGLWMLIAQAHRAAELFTARNIPKFRIGEIHAHIRALTQNIVLVGMPGSGKSEIGRAVAGTLNRELIDLDAEIAKRAGMSIPEIFETHGEKFFRNLESELIAEYGRKKSLVIATGGGAVLREENMRALFQNGEIICIDRPVELLATQGRPLSASPEALYEMNEKRRPYYRRHAAKVVANTGTVEEASAAVVEGFYEATRH